MIHLTRRATRTMKNSSALLSLILLVAAPQANAADGKLVIEAGKIVTLTGEVIENGKIVIVDGRITAVGADVDAPWDARKHRCLPLLVPSLDARLYARRERSAVAIPGARARGGLFGLSRGAAIRTPFRHFWHDFGVSNPPMAINIVRVPWRRNRGTRERSGRPCGFSFC